MIGTIIFLVIAALIIYAVIDDKKTQKEAARKKAQEEQEKREFERQTAQKIQTTKSRVLNSTFYRELLSELKMQIQKDMRNRLTKRYDEYMKKPGAIQSGFRSFAEQNYLYTALGDIAVTPEGIYYRTDSWHAIMESDLNWCEFQFNCSKHGYSNLDPIQQWALAEMLSKEVGYKLTYYRPNRVDFRDEDSHNYVRCSDTATDAANYLNLTKECANRHYGGEEVYIDLLPSVGTSYLSQLMDSEIERLQNSGISYKSPF